MNLLFPSNPEYLLCYINSLRSSTVTILRSQTRTSPLRPHKSCAGEFFLSFSSLSLPQITLQPLAVGPCQRQGARQKILQGRTARGVSMWSWGRPVWVFCLSVHRITLLFLLIVNFLLLKDSEHLCLHKSIGLSKLPFQGKLRDLSGRRRPVWNFVQINVLLFCFILFVWMLQFWGCNPAACSLNFLPMHWGGW